MALKHGLGRGLGALIKDGTPAAPPPESGSSVLKIDITRLRANTVQPRHRFDAAPLAELAASIREHGVLQPLLVRTSGDDYELIAGERRLRAATEAGLTKVPAIVVTADDSAALELALVENLQREDLNPLEEAQGYQALADKFGLTQEQIAGRVGKARASVANALRLLSLPDEVKESVARGLVKPGHAKVIASLDSITQQTEMARRVVSEDLSVRALEQVVEKSRRAPRKPRAARSDIPATHLRYISDRLHGHFGTAVRITPCRTYANGKKGKGMIEIDYYSDEDLDRILEILGLTDE